MGSIDPSEYDESVLELLHQPWTIEIHPYPDGGWFARVVELPGCMTEADSGPEVLEALEEARAEWLAAALEQGLTIPLPVAAQEHSGKIFVRTSPELHRMVADAAARRGVSMSQWVAELLAREVGTSSRPPVSLRQEDVEALVQAVAAAAKATPRIGKAMGAAAPRVKKSRAGAAAKASPRRASAR